MEWPRGCSRPRAMRACSLQADALLLRAGVRRRERSYRRRSSCRPLAIDLVAKILPGKARERIRTSGVAYAAVRQHVRSGFGGALGQDVLKAFLDERAEGLARALGQTFGTQEQRVLNIQRRLHRAI